MTQYNRFMGEYSDNTDYEKGDVVVFDGAAYYRKMPGKGISPIARKKPYLVWSRLNENLSTVFPLGGGSGGGSTGSGLPSGGTPYQYLVTDGEGNTGWADRLAWKEGIEVTWDGNTDGLVIVDLGGPKLCKVSDLIPDDETIKLGTLVVRSGENTMSIVIEEHWNRSLVNEDIVIIGEGYLAVVRQPTTSNGFSFEESGIYFIAMDSMYCESFTSVSTIHPIPAEYLPDAQIVTFEMHENGVDTVCSHTTEEILAMAKKGYIAGKAVLNGAEYPAVYVGAVPDGSVTCAVFQLTMLDGTTLRTSGLAVYPGADVVTFFEYA